MHIKVLQLLVAYGKLLTICSVSIITIMIIVVTWLGSSSKHRANYALTWSSTRSQQGMPQSCLIYRGSTHYSTGNRRINGLGNPRNGTGILATGLQHVLTY